MEFVCIGKIVNTHGIKGELKIESYSDFNNLRYKPNSFVYVSEDKIKYEINSYSDYKRFILVSFKDNLDINLVKKLKNEYVYKAKEDIKPLKKGDYYFSELKDMDLFIDDKFIGKVIKVEEGLKHNNLRVLVDNKEYLIPYVKDVFVKNVDLERKRIDYLKMDGLFKWRSLF